MTTGCSSTKRFHPRFTEPATGMPPFHPSYPDGAQAPSPASQPERKAQSFNIAQAPSAIKIMQSASKCPLALYALSQKVITWIALSISSQWLAKALVGRKYRGLRILHGSADSASLGASGDGGLSRCSHQGCPLSLINA
eukprot:1145307-Pelagomonas_calceolata.AAC.7